MDQKSHNKEKWLREDDSYRIAKLEQIVKGNGSKGHEQRIDDLEEMTQKFNDHKQTMIKRLSIIDETLKHLKSNKSLILTIGLQALGIIGIIVTNFVTK